MSVLGRRPALRWVVPSAAVVLVVGSAVAAGSASAGDHPDLPPVSAQQLLTDVASSDAPPVQGTVSVTMRLGLPDLELPAAGPGAGGDPSSVTSLLAGTHTVRVWSDGPTRSRVAVLGGQSESDVVREGADVWLWSSADRTAVHATVPADPTGASGRTLPSDVPTTPAEAARAALDAVDPTTVVATDDTATVAGRPAYTLTLTPKASERTLVREVAIDVDATRHVPLRVRVWSTQASKPAVDVGFTDVSFATPPASTFEFTPPSDATVTEAPAADHADRAGAAGAGTADEPTIVGDGWDAVVVQQLDASTRAALTGGGATGATGSGAGEGAASYLQQLPTVSGAWGSGRVLHGTLFSAVLTDDGRVAVGAVPVDVLTAALASAPQG